MGQQDNIQLFESKMIRTVWNEEQEDWYFCVIDVVEVLTGSTNPTDYLKKMRKRDEQLASYLGTNCPQIEMKGATGKKRKVLAAEKRKSSGQYEYHGNHFEYAGRNFNQRDFPEGTATRFCRKSAGRPARRQHCRHRPQSPGERNRPNDYYIAGRCSAQCTRCWYD